MKNILFIVALTILLRPVFPVVEYLVNYNYIATRLCENRDRPELLCNGKCYLKKELVKEIASDAKKDTPKQEVKKIEITWLAAINYLKLQCITILPKAAHIWRYVNNYTYLTYKLLLKPPMFIN